MATVTITYAAGTNAGAQLRRLAHQLEKAVIAIPDNVPTGASTVLTIDNNPTGGTASVQVTAGPYQSSLFLV